LRVKNPRKNEILKAVYGQICNKNGGICGIIVVYTEQIPTRRACFVKKGLKKRKYCDRKIRRWIMVVVLPLIPAA
jgi:hypothetical protein